MRVGIRSTAMAAALLLIVGCNQQLDSRGPRNSQHGPGIGPKYGDQFVVAWAAMDSPKNEYWKAYDDGLRAAVEDAGGRLLYLSAQGDPIKQHDCVSQAIAQDVDMLLVYPIDSNAIGGAVREANEAGIPVGALWNLVPTASGAEMEMTVVIKAEEAAAKSAQVIVDKLTEKYGQPQGTVLEVQGRMITTGAIRRGAGFHEVVDQYPEIKVTSKPGDWDTGKGTTAIQDWMTAHPETDAIFFHSDGAYTPAAIAALTPLGRWAPTGREGHIICAGVDGSNVVVHAIKHGYMEYTSGAEHADAGGLLGSLAMEFLQTGKRLQAGDQVQRPDTRWKVAEVGHDPKYSGPLVYLPISPISAENAADPELFANKYQSAPNGLGACVWE